MLPLTRSVEAQQHREQSRASELGEPAQLRFSPPKLPQAEEQRPPQSQSARPGHRGHSLDSDRSGPAAADKRVGTGTQRGARWLRTQGRPLRNTHDDVTHSATERHRLSSNFFFIKHIPQYKALDHERYLYNLTVPRSGSYTNFPNR